VIVPLSDADLTTVIYPRLKTERRPVFTSIADGKGVKVVTSAGTDYIFLALQPFSYREGVISFQGTVGAVLSRSGEAILWLGQPGRIAAGGKAVVKDGPRP